MSAQQSIPFWDRLLIIDESGLTLYSDHYSNDDYNLIIGGLFQAIDTFFTTEFDDELRELRGVKYHASILQRKVKSATLLFIGLTQSEICEKKRRKELEFVTNRFIMQFHPVITNTIDDPYLFNDFKKTPKTRKDAALTQISDSLQLNPKLTFKKKKVSNTVIKKEIVRILKFLKLPMVLKQPVLERTRKYLEIFDSRLKFHDFKKCIPIALYLHCMEHHIVIDWRELINASHITENELKAVIIQLENHDPDYFQD